MLSAHGVMRYNLAGADRLNMRKSPAILLLTTARGRTRSVTNASRQEKHFEEKEGEFDRNREVCVIYVLDAAELKSALSVILCSYTSF